jgi:putative FmdB family regulatory protein
MPNYDYRCLKCDKIEERFITIAKKDDPLQCSCGKNGELKRMVSNPTISSDTINPIRRAGSGWNDVLKKIKKNSGSNNIEHY